MRIGPYHVDGYETDEATGQVTIYEFQGCYYHGHDCFLNRTAYSTAAATVENSASKPSRMDNNSLLSSNASSDAVVDQSCDTTNVMSNREKQARQRANHTKCKLEFLRKCGARVVELKECEFVVMKKRDQKLRDFIGQQRPSFYQKHPSQVTTACLLDAVVNGELFGALEVDIHVKQEDYDRWQDFSPLFTSTDIPFSAIGKTMQDYWNTTNRCRSTGKPKQFPTKRLLVGGMQAVKIMLSSDLLQWYLRHGLVCTKIYQVSCVILGVKLDIRFMYQYARRSKL